MKFPALLTCLLAAVLSALPMSHARADDVSFDVFYNSLADDGDWYNTPEYGYVWQPSIGYQNDKWRPYADGYWAQTDDGWTWVSYENFGWATYHYGRWTRLEGTGWVWVPGYEWGPGWVSWRTNNDYVGWAPLPPKRERNGGGGNHGGGGSGASLTVDYNTVESEDGYDNTVDQQYDIGPDNYCFVQTSNFGAPVLREVIVPQQRNIVIIEDTVNVTHITYRRGPDRVVVHNYGPDYDFIRTRVDRPIQQLRIERRDNVDFLHDRGSDRHNPNVVRDGVFQIAAPNINRRQVNFSEVRPTRVRQDLRDARVEHGWRNTGADQPTVQRVREQFQQQARDRATRPPGNPTANTVPVPNDVRRERERERTNVPPAPGATPAITNNQPFNRPDDERRARRDAAQRDREARENGRANGGQPTPGANRERDSRRQPGAQDQTEPAVATPTTTPANPNQDRRQRGPRQTDAPATTPPTATPPQADNQRGDRRNGRRQPNAQPSVAPGEATPENRRNPSRQPETAPANTPTAAPSQADSQREDRRSQRRQHQDAQPSAAPGEAPPDSRRGPRTQERTQPAATPAQTKPAESDRNAARQQEQERAQAQRQQAQQAQSQAREQQQQRSQEQQAQRQEQKQQRSQEQQTQRQQAQQERQPAQQTQPAQQAQQRQPEQAQRRQEPQPQPSPAAKSDDDKKKRRDGQPQQ